MTDIVVDQKPFVELEKRTCVSACAGVQEELTGHAQMDAEGAAGEFEDYEFAVALYRLDQLAAQLGGELIEILADYEVRKELGTPDFTAGQSRSQRTDDGFNFW